MNWPENLQPASFRGVPFNIQTTRAGYGRRNVVHEYPDRDTPLAEDLGRRAQSFKITGFILGDDAITESDALIEACEAKGPGKLVHPVRGEIVVVCNRCDVTDSFLEGRMFRFAIDFSEAGAIVEPSAKMDTASTLQADIDESRAELIEHFELLVDVVNLPDYLLNEVTGFVTGVADAIEGLRPRFLLPDYAASFDRLIAALGFDGAAQLANGTVVSTIFSAVETLGDSVAPELAAERIPALLGVVAPATPSVRTQAPLSALSGAIETAALLEIAAISSVLQFTNQGAAIVQRDQLRDQFDAGIENAASRFDDTAFSALQRVATAALRDITDRGASLAPMIAWQPARSVPAVVAAWQLYSDSARSAEIADQLGANHPLFLPTSGRVVSK
jgi:prophage DNA circulation protein